MWRHIRRGGYNVPTGDKDGVRGLKFLNFVWRTLWTAPNLLVLYILQLFTRMQFKNCMRYLSKGRLTGSRGREKINICRDLQDPTLETATTGDEPTKPTIQLTCLQIIWRSNGDEIFCQRWSWFEPKEVYFNIKSHFSFSILNQDYIRTKAMFSSSYLTVEHKWLEWSICLLNFY